jgi:hypothetical protein
LNETAQVIASITGMIAAIGTFCIRYGRLRLDWWKAKHPVVTEASRQQGTTITPR